MSLFRARGKAECPLSVGLALARDFLALLGRGLRIVDELERRIAAEPEEVEWVVVGRNAGWLLRRRGGLRRRGARGCGRGRGRVGGGRTRGREPGAHRGGPDVGE